MTVHRLGERVRGEVGEFMIYMTVNRLGESERAI